MKCSFSKMAIIVTLGLATSFGASASGNNGKVTFSGEVVDAPCNLAPGNDGTDIKVPFGQLSMSQLNQGHEAAEKFQILLQDCDLTTKKAQITFSSQDQLPGKNMLGTRGSAKGLAISLNNVELGVAKALNGLNPTGDNTITYTAVAKKADEKTSVTAGTFEAITNFMISYQ